MRKTTQIPDASVFEEFRAGNVRAFSIYYDLYSRLIFLTTYKILGNKWFDENQFEAETIVSETFVKLWENRSSIQSPAHLKNFLFITARNLTINVLYKRKNESRIESLNEAHILAEDGTSKERILAEVSFQLWKTANEMPHRMKEVFILRYRTGKSAREVAELLKIKVSTVHDQTKKALQFMRESLPQAFWDHAEVFLFFISLCYLHITGK